MQVVKSLVEKISQKLQSDLRLHRLVISIFIMVIIFALFDISLFVRGTEAVFVDQVASTVAEFIAGTWETKNCTFSHGYWKEHPEEWPVEEITISGVTYPKELALEVMEKPPKGDATYILIQQLIASKLNIENGADATVIDEYVGYADSWLVDHPLGSDPQEPDRHQGIALAKVLDLYNNGLLGPGPCLEETGVMSVPPLERILRPYDPELPVGSNPLTQIEDSDQEPVGKETPIPTPTPAPSQGVPPLPTSTPTERIPPAPTSTLTGTPRPTPIPAPTLAPYFTPTTETPRPTPTPAPTMGITPSPTSAPTEEATPTPTPPTPTPTPTEYSGPSGCSQGMDYWISHPEGWTLSEFQLGEEIYDQVEALAILTANPQGDATYILAQQYITARLNIASPADPTDIVEVLELANSWFLDNPLGSAPKNPERKAGLDLAQALEEYNLGLTGPGMCELNLSTSTPTTTSTPEPTPTSMPSITPSPTLAPTDQPAPSDTPASVIPTPTP